ncbi:MAG: methyltransferase domain-containing protein [Elusimicrobia bacterium]|nr:methyltransferase domain-containing protein [Elusimicrobiota bacterium]
MRIHRQADPFKNVKTSGPNLITQMDQLSRLLIGYRGIKTLLVACELDLFRCLGETDGSLPALAKRTGIKSHRLGVILDGLASLGLIRKSARRYRNTVFSRRWLHPESPSSLANTFRYQELLSPAYARLTETVRKGRPKQNLTDLLSQRPDFVGPYIGGMADISKGPAKELARALDLSRARDFLDVGGGPGVYSLTFLSRAPALNCVIMDLPETLRHTRRYVDASPHQRRVALRAGDYHAASFGEDCFDLVLMSHITHDEGPEQNKRLIRKAFSALRSGGQIVIHDFMTAPDRIRPVFSALFSVHMMTFTRWGRTYSVSDYKAWLENAGFLVRRAVAISPKAASATMALIASKG